MSARLILLRHDPRIRFALALLLVAAVAVGCDHGGDKPTRPYGW